MLNHEQMALIARLTDDAAFQLVLDGLKAEIDNISDALYRASSDEEEKRLLSRWRGLKDALAYLAHIPEEMKTEVGKTRPPTPTVDNEAIHPHGPLWDRFLKEHYETMRNAPVVYPPPPTIPFSNPNNIPWYSPAHPLHVTGINTGINTTPSFPQMIS